MPHSVSPLLTSANIDHWSDVDIHLKSKIEETKNEGHLNESLKRFKPIPGKHN